MTTTEPATDDPQALADLEEVCRLLSEGERVTDPDLLHRIGERATAARAEDLRRFGIREIAVDLVRELRDAR